MTDRTLISDQGRGPGLSRDGTDEERAASVALLRDRNRRRRALRRTLILASIPLAIAVLILAAKLFSLTPTARAVVDSYSDGDFATSVSHAEPLLTWNSFEPWVAWFDRGTAVAATGDYNAAIADLELAFQSAPAERKCEVAVNLSLSWESLGDSYIQQGLYEGAARLYETAQAVIDAAGAACEPGRAPFNELEGRDPGEELADAEAGCETERTSRDAGG